MIVCSNVSKIVKDNESAFRRLFYNIIKQKRKRYFYKFVKYVALALQNHQNKNKSNNSKTSKTAYLA